MGLVMYRLFNNKPENTKEGFVARGLWTGDDSQQPPPFLGTQPPASTNHYLTSGAAVIDSQDVEDLIKLVRAGGFGLSGTGQTLLLLCNPIESAAVQTWRNGVESRAGGPLAKHDWVPATTAPPHYSADVLVGQAASGDFSGVEVLGTYGYVKLIETPYVPAGFIAVVASGGNNSPLNCIGFRQDPDPAMQGLRIIPGSDSSPYPVIGSYLLRVLWLWLPPTRWCRGDADQHERELYPAASDGLRPVSGGRNDRQPKLGPERHVGGEAHWRTCWRF